MSDRRQMFRLIVALARVRTAALGAGAFTLPTTLQESEGLDRCQWNVCPDSPLFLCKRYMARTPLTRVGYAAVLHVGISNVAYKSVGLHT